MDSYPFDQQHQPFFTVGQVADLLGVQPAFLRRLETEAVVQPERSDGGQRRYSRVEIDIAQRAVELMSEGMTLAGIRRLLEAEAEVAHLRRQLKEAKDKERRERLRHREGTSGHG